MNLSYFPIRRVALLCAFILSATVSAKPTGEAVIQAKKLSFIENKGQVTTPAMQPRQDIQYKLDLEGMTAFIGNGAIHYQWAKQTAASKPITNLPGWELKREKTIPFETYRLDMVLQNARLDAPATVAEEQGYYETYYLPHTGNGIKAHSYNRITYHDVYPHIDWVLYTKNNKLKYDFIVHPGGDVNKIRMQYNGATAMNEAEGKIIIATPFGSITEDKPYTYDAETHSEIPSAFAMLSNNTLGFNIAAGNNAIVIDPALKWTTYYGGSLDDEATSVSTDRYGNVYMGGHTISTNNIATSGAYLTTLTGITYDGFLMKMDADGVRLWATYFGGSNADYVNAITTGIDGYGTHVVLVGNTYSGNGIATGSTAFNNSAKSDAYYIVFQPDGTKLAGNYISGSDDDIATCIVYDNSKYAAYIGGYTGSSFITQITPAGSNKTTNAGGTDGFVVACSIFGGNNIQGSFYGGTGDDYITGITTGNHHIYCCGNTNSPSGIIYGTAYQPASGGNTDGFIFTTNDPTYQPSGATYYGGSGNDYLNSICLSDNGSVIVAGSSYSTSGISSLNTHQVANAGMKDGILAKFSSTSQLLWGTYTGGTSNDELTAVTAGYGSNIYVSGHTSSTSGIASPGAAQSALSGVNDLSLASFNATDGTRNWGTYWGGNVTENIPSAISYGIAGQLYLAGTTNSSNMGTINVHQQYISGGTDGFLSSIDADTGAYIEEQTVPSPLCGFSVLNVSIRSSNNFDPNNIFSLYISDNGSIPGTLLGTLQSSSGGIITATIPNTLDPTKKHQLYVTSSSPVRSGYLLNANSISYNITATPSGPIYTGFIPNIAVGPGTSLKFALALPPAMTPISYQWQKNGVDIPGAIHDTLLATAGTDIADGDSVWCMVTSLWPPCNLPIPYASNTVYMKMSLGISDVDAGKDTYIYPNPSKGSFTIRSNHNITAGIITLTDVTGKNVYSSHLPENAKTATLTLPEALPNGIYLLKLKEGETEQKMKLSLQR